MKKRTVKGYGRSITFVLICILGGAPTEIAAQEPLVLEPGVLVRVTALDCGLRGRAATFRGFRADTLILGTTECPLASVTRLDVSRGQKSHVFVGFLVGAGAGLVGSLAVCNFTDTCQVFSDNDVRGDVVTVSGLMGGALGGITGYLVKSDRWEEVPLERLRVSLAPQRDGGFALGFSVRF